MGTPRVLRGRPVLGQRLDQHRHVGDDGVVDSSVNGDSLVLEELAEDVHRQAGRPDEGGDERLGSPPGPPRFSRPGPGR